MSCIGAATRPPGRRAPRPARRSARRRAAAGTDLSFARKRSWLDGIPEPDRRGRPRRSASSRRGTPRRRPASRPRATPLRLSGRGLAPLSGWRAMFSPWSSNIARSCSGVLPSVVRKLPIITPLTPARTASGCSSARFSTRPPQSRNSASGSTSRKIAIHFTASHGSISSRSPNFVPAFGISRLIGTLVGSTSASWKAISTRCSGVSPRFRMPPTQVSRPASLTASIVRSRPS